MLPVFTSSSLGQKKKKSSILDCCGTSMSGAMAIHSPTSRRRPGSGSAQTRHISSTRCGRPPTRSPSVIDDDIWPYSVPLDFPAQWVSCRGGSEGRTAAYGQGNRR